MAPIYDIRDPSEPSSDDDSFEEVLGNLFSENTASPADDRRASGSGESVPDDVDKRNELENSGANNGSELPTEGDSSIEVIDLPNDPIANNGIRIPPSTDELLKKRETDDNSRPEDVSKISPGIDSIKGIHAPTDGSEKTADGIRPGDDGSFEKRKTGPAEPKNEIDHNSHGKVDGNKLESLSCVGMDPDLVQTGNLNTDDGSRIYEVYCVGEGIVVEVPCTGDSDGIRPNSQPGPSMGGVKENLMAFSTVVQDQATPTPGHQPRTTANKATLEWIGKFSSPNGEQYIKAKGRSSAKIPQLGFSARLTYGQLHLAIHNQGSLMVTSDTFVARVRIDQPQLLNGTRKFSQAAEVLLNHLRIDQVYFDKVATDRDAHRDQFLKKLENVIKQLAVAEGKVGMRIQLLKFVERSKQRGSLTYVELCRGIQDYPALRQALHEEAEELEKVEQQVTRRERMFNRFKYHPKDSSPDPLQRLDDLVKGMVEQHRNILLAEAPAFLHKPLHDISVKDLILISSSDVKLFTDMTSALKAEIFEKPLEDLAHRWISRIKSIKADCRDEPLQLTSIILFYLAKSLQELIAEITEHTDHRPTDLLTSSALGWFPIKKIVWKSESALTRCLQGEYEFIFRLLNHFDDVSDFGRQPFRYRMQVFNNGQSSTSAGLLRDI